MKGTFGVQRIPIVGSVWRHKNGTLYTVDLLLNLHSTDSEFPIIIGYHSSSMKAWGRPLYRWHESMTLASEDDLNPFHLRGVANE